MNTILRRYCKENVIIKITEFKLLDVSVYGCDACFDIEIHDKESGVLLETTYENVDNAFMGVDDSEEIYYFLEDKEIDFMKPAAAISILSSYQVCSQMIFLLGCVNVTRPANT